MSLRDGALYVEDDADTRDMMATGLRFHGARVMTAETAQMALQLFEARQPDVIVSDLFLPDVDGAQPPAGAGRRGRDRHAFRAVLGCHGLVVSDGGRFQLSRRVLSSRDAEPTLEHTAPRSSLGTGRAINPRASSHAQATALASPAAPASNCGRMGSKDEARGRTAGVGGADGDRTRDLVNAIDVVSEPSHGCSSRYP
jgi:hypothetical protein